MCINPECACEMIEYYDETFISDLNNLREELFCKYSQLLGDVCQQEFTPCDADHTRRVLLGIRHMLTSEGCMDASILTALSNLAERTERYQLLLPKLTTIHRLDFAITTTTNHGIAHANGATVTVRDNRFVNSRIYLDNNPDLYDELIFLTAGFRNVGRLEGNVSVGATSYQSLAHRFGTFAQTHEYTIPRQQIPRSSLVIDQHFQRSILQAHTPDLLTSVQQALQPIIIHAPCNFSEFNSSRGWQDNTTTQDWNRVQQLPIVNNTEAYTVNGRAVRTIPILRFYNKLVWIRTGGPWSHPARPNQPTWEIDSLPYLISTWHGAPYDGSVTGSTNNQGSLWPVPMNWSAPVGFSLPNGPMSAGISTGLGIDFWTPLTTPSTVTSSPEQLSIVAVFGVHETQP